MSDTLTILGVHDPLWGPQKTVYPDGRKNYQIGNTFFFRQSPQLNTIDDLARALEKLYGDPRFFVIRGEPKPGILHEKSQWTEPESWHRRLCHDRSDAQSTVESIDRQWIMVDIDDVPYTDFLPPTQESINLLIRDELPEEFHGVSYCYKFSSTAGVPAWTTWKIHLWFWLDRPVCDDSIKNWLRDCRVDRQIYNPVTPHDVSYPNLIGDDPFDSIEINRQGYVHRPYQVVQLPKSVLNQRDHDTLQKQSNPISYTVQQSTTNDDYNREIQYAIDCVSNAPVGNRNETLYKQTFRMVKYLNSGVVSEHDIRQDFQHVAESIGLKKREIKHTIDSAIQSGRGAGHVPESTISPNAEYTPRRFVTVPYPQRADLYEEINQWPASLRIEWYETIETAREMCAKNPLFIAPPEESIVEVVAADIVLDRYGRHREWQPNENVQYTNTGNWELNQ